MPRPPEIEHSFVEGAHGLHVATDLGVDLIVEADGLDAARELAPAVSEEAAECVRIESGRPRLGMDMGSNTIPQEAGLNERAVSFTKGCYVGQETVARLHYRGKPNRHLRGLELSEPVAARRPDRARGEGGGRRGVRLRLAPARADRARAGAPRGRARRLGGGGRRARRRGRVAVRGLDWPRETGAGAGDICRGVDRALACPRSRPPPSRSPSRPARSRYAWARSPSRWPSWTAPTATC